MSALLPRPLPKIGETLVVGAGFFAACASSLNRSKIARIADRVAGRE
jgi:hypothetical protein